MRFFHVGLVWPQEFISFMYNSSSPKDNFIVAFVWGYVYVCVFCLFVCTQQFVHKDCILLGPWDKSSGKEAWILRKIPSKQTNVTYHQQCSTDTIELCENCLTFLFPFYIWVCVCVQRFLHVHIVTTLIRAVYGEFDSNGENRAV